MKNSIQCAACFQIVDVDPEPRIGTLHKCNGKDRRVYAELKVQASPNSTKKKGI